jgi:hypothetical protein
MSTVYLLGQRLGPDTIKVRGVPLTAREPGGDSTVTHDLWPESDGPEMLTLCGRRPANPDGWVLAVVPYVTCADCGEILLRRNEAIEMTEAQAVALIDQMTAHHAGHPGRSR